MLTDYNSPTFSGWRKAAGNVWADYTQHAFVTGLGDGSLPREAFMQYLIQDYIFLVHFTRAWALVIVKADTPEHMRIAEATVHALINEEIQLHIDICKREGITEDDLNNATEAIENIAYTRYVMDAGLSGDLLDLLAALAPCVMGYGEIGLALKNTTNTQAPYQQWIATYASEDYQEVCTIVSELIENVAQATLGENPKNSARWPALCERFTTATRLEVDFWQMGLRLAETT